MIKPIFFPYTYISGTTAAELKIWFQQMIVYSPLLPADLNIPHITEDATRNSDLIDLQTPIQGDEDYINRALQEFRAWGELHQNFNKEAVKLTGNAIPFFNETSSQQIKADIKKGLSNNAETEKDPLLKARIFLQMAHDFDQQNDEIEQKMLLFKNLEQNLINNLTGSENNSDFSKEESFLPDTSDNFMIEQRIASWSRLFMHASECLPLFITTSRSAIDYLTDKAENAAKILTINDNDPEKSSALAKIEDLAGKVWEPSSICPSEQQNHDTLTSKTCNSLTFYIIPNQTPHKFFASCVDIDISEVDFIKEKKKIKNTILGLYQKSHKKSSNR